MSTGSRYLNLAQKNILNKGKKGPEAIILTLIINFPQNTIFGRPSKLIKSNLPNFLCQKFLYTKAFSIKVISHQKVLKGLVNSSCKGRCYVLLLRFSQGVCLGKCVENCLLLIQDCTFVQDCIFVLIFNVIRDI